jgi:hypothetical protein
MSSTEFAKAHLREHLVGLLVGPVADGFWSIYDSSKELSERNGQPDQILRTFQNMLTRIPDWTETTLGTEVDRIIKVTGCTYMDDLLMGVFISYMKSFASLHYRGTQSELKIDFDRPSFAKFVHELYKQSARKIWQMAYYFKTVGVSSEQQARNRQDIEKIVTDCMEQVIRSFLPWEAIAKKYFADDEYVPERLPTLETPAPRVVPVAPPTQQVTFDDADLEEEDEEEEGSDGTEDDRSELNLGDEDATIEFEDLDKKPEEPAKKDEEPEKEEEDDPLKEIEGKVTEDTLVLNL